MTVFGRTEHPELDAEGSKRNRNRSQARSWRLLSVRQVVTTCDSIHRDLLQGPNKPRRHDNRVIADGSSTVSFGFPEINLAGACPMNVEEARQPSPRLPCCVACTKKILTRKREVLTFGSFRRIVPGLFWRQDGLVSRNNPLLPEESTPNGVEVGLYPKDLCSSGLLVCIHNILISGYFVDNLIREKNLIFVEINRESTLCQAPKLSGGRGLHRTRACEQPRAGGTLPRGHRRP